MTGVQRCRRTSEVESLRGAELQVVPGIRLVRHHRGDRVHAMAPELALQRFRRSPWGRAGDVEPARSARRGRSAAARRRRRAPARRETRAWHHLHRIARHGDQLALGDEVHGPDPARPGRRGQDRVRRRGVVPERVHQLAPGPPVEPAGRGGQLGLGLLLEVQAVAPELRARRPSARARGGAGG